MIQNAREKKENMKKLNNKGDRSSNIFLVEVSAVERDQDRGIT